MDVLDGKKEGIRHEMDMELESLRSLSPRAIPPLTGNVDFQETNEDAVLNARKRIPTEKGRQ